MPSLTTSGSPTFNGDSCTINATGSDRVSCPDVTLLNQTQMWFAIRAKLGFASTDANERSFWRYGPDTNNELFLQYGPAAGNLTAGRDGVGGAGQPVISGLSFLINTDHTMIGAFTASLNLVSWDGAAFVSTANSKVADMTGLTLWDIGQRGYSFTGIIDSDVYWAAAGLGVLTDADAAAIHAFGNTNPDIFSFPGKPTFLWKAVDATYEMLRYVAPDADVVTTGWATAPLFSKVNDASDATVIAGTAS